jgi:hypothetical protein
MAREATLTATDTGGDAGRPLWPLLIAPSLVVGAILLLKVSSDLVHVGPWDRATFGWAVPIPMLLIAPAVAGLVARWTGERRAAVAIVLLAAGLGLVLTAVLTATVDRIGCEPVADKARILGHVAPIGVVAGLGFATAAWVGLKGRTKPIVALAGGLAVAIGAGIATLITFGILVPGVTCVPGPAPG